jgi:hypothetical protein
VLVGLVGRKRPAYIQSSPGIGKTDIASQVAKRLDMPCIHIHAPSLLIENLGIPWPVKEEKRIEFFMTNLLPVLESTHSESGIILLDEAGQAGPEIQKVLANLIQARECYGHSIKPGWAFILTGNRTEDRAGANTLLTHFADRMTILSLDFDIKSWIEWADASGVVHEKVISYAMFAPQNINSFDPSRQINATPRSWAEGVSGNMAVVPPEALLEVLTGDVGGAAVEFMGFLEWYGILPTKAEFLAHPKESVTRLKEYHKIEVKDADGNISLKMTQTPGRNILSPDLGYALAGMLYHNNTIEDFPAAMNAAKELPLDSGAMVFLRYFNKHRQVSLKYRTIVKECLSLYNGVVLGESFAERDIEKESA